jgi:hypothetical protein
MTTYVLVHGAWHSGQCWARVVPRLAASSGLCAAAGRGGDYDARRVVGLLVAGLAAETSPLGRLGAAP